MTRPRGELKRFMRKGVKVLRKSKQHSAVSPMRVGIQWNLPRSNQLQYRCISVERPDLVVHKGGTLPIFRLSAEVPCVVSGPLGFVALFSIRYRWFSVRMIKALPSMAGVASSG